MRVLILACLCCLAFGGAELKDLKETNKILKQALREIKLRREAQVGQAPRELQVGSGWCTQADLDRGCKQMRDCVCPPSEGEATMKVAMKNLEKSVGVTYEDKGSSGMCYTETYTFDSKCQPDHNMILEDLGIFYAMWCCKPKSTRELQVGTSGFCTQADLDRGCKQYRDCLCPPSEALTLLKSEERVGAKECRWCDCTHWDESSYSQCSPIANQEAGIYHTVKCREDGVTPMPGHWTSHDAECAKYSGGSSWFVGQAGDGKSCDAICGDQGMHCDKKGLEIQTKSELSSVCQQVTGWSGTAKGTRDIRPHTNTQTKACYGYDLWDSHPSSCSAVPTDPTYARICACV